MHRYICENKSECKFRDSVHWYCIVYCLLQKPGAMQSETNAISKHLKAFPSLQLGDRKNPY